MQIVVHAEVTSPFSGKQMTTNVFHYTYESPEYVQPVMPSTYNGMSVTNINGSSPLLEPAWNLLAGVNVCFAAHAENLQRRAGTSLLNARL